MGCNQGEVDARFAYLNEQMIEAKLDPAEWGVFA